MLGDLEKHLFSVLFFVCCRLSFAFGSTVLVRYAIVHLDELLKLGCGQGQALIQGLLDGVQDELLQLAATLPTLVPQLHLKLQLAVDVHEFAVRLPIDCSPCHMEKSLSVKLILDLEIE